MPGPGRCNGGAGTSTLALAVPFLLLALVLPTLALPVAADDLTPHDPIDLTGDDAVDAFFAGEGTDGLSWETAHVLEGLRIDAGSRAWGVRIVGTTRYVVVRGCEVVTSDTETTDHALYLEGCSHIRVEGCALPKSDIGIYAKECDELQVLKNDISGQKRESVQVVLSGNVTLEGNEIRFQESGIAVRNSFHVSISDNNLPGRGTVGLDLSAVEDVDVTGNTLGFTTYGVRMMGSKDVHLSENTVQYTDYAGFDLRRCQDVVIDDNEVFGSSRGVQVDDSTRVLVEANEISWDDVGVRLMSSSDCQVLENRISSSISVGIDLDGADDNVVEGNTLSNCVYAIRLSSSRGNTIADNTIMGTWWGSFDGDTAGNVVRDNTIRADAWLRWTIVVIVALVVVVASIAVRSTRRYKRMRKGEKGNIMVRQRFPAGRRGYWAMSKVLWTEDFFRSQLDSAGPNKETILNQYRESITSARINQYMAIGTMSVFLAFQAGLPLTGLAKLSVQDVGSSNVNDLLFATAISFGLYYLISFMILFLFGLLFMAQLMKGRTFALLGTMPLDRSGMRRMVVYLILRMFGLPFGVVLLTLPIGGFIVTHSILFSLVSLAVNFLYLAFIAFVLVLVTNSVSHKLSSGKASKTSTLMRFMMIAGYIIGMMTVFLVFQFALTYISGLFTDGGLEGVDGSMLNTIMAVIAFPMAGSYLCAASIVPLGELPASVMLTTAIGLAVSLGAVFVMKRRVFAILERVARGEELPDSGAVHATTIDKVSIVTMRPIRAFMKNALLVASRDTGSTLFLVMPIMFPLLMIVPMYSDEVTMSQFEAVMPFIFYLGLMPFLVNMALSSADAEMGGVLSALPYTTLDLYRAKWLNITWILMIPLGLVTGLLVWTFDDKLVFLGIMASLAFLIMVLAALYLISFSMVFGRVNRRPTFFMTHVVHKLPKYIAIVGAQYVIVIVEMVLFFGLTGLGVMSVGTGVTLLIVGNLFLFLVLELVARRLFGALPTSPTPGSPPAGAAPYEITK